MAFMPAIRLNGLTGQLGSTMSDTDTEMILANLPVHSGSAEIALEAIEAPDYLILSLFSGGNLREIVHVVGYDPITDPLLLTVERAKEGTIAVEHLAGTRWLHALTSQEAYEAQDLAQFRGDWEDPTDTVLWSTDFSDAADLTLFSWTYRGGAAANGAASRQVLTGSPATDRPSFSFGIRVTADSGSTGNGDSSFLMDPDSVPALAGKYLTKFRAWLCSTHGSTRLPLAMETDNAIGPSTAAAANTWFNLEMKLGTVVGPPFGPRLSDTASGFSNPNGWFTGIEVYGVADSADLYQLNDVVAHNDAYWRSLYANNDAEPGVSGSWALVTTGPAPIPFGGSVSIGTVSLGSPGSAAVSNSGDQTDVVLNFTIPQGYPGVGSTYDRRWAIGAGEVSIDEFNNDSIDAAWVRADGTGAVVGSLDWVEGGDVLAAAHNTGADTANFIHALLRPLTGAGGAMAVGDAFISAFTLFGDPDASYTMGGLVLSTSATFGSGTQLVNLNYNTTTSGKSTSDLRTLTNFNTAGVGATGPIDIPGNGMLRYTRLVKISSTTWRLDTSPDGIGWMKNSTTITWANTPTHIGFLSSNWGNGVASIVSYEFLRRVSGVS